MLLRQFGWDAPAPAKSRSEAIVVRPVRSRNVVTGDGSWWARFWGAVNAKMPQWVPNLSLHQLRRVHGGWRAVASFRESGSGTPLPERDLNLAIRETGRIKDHAGGSYNALSLVAVCLFGGNTPQGCAEARKWLCDEISFDDTPAVIDPPATSTYADNRVSIDEASEPLRAVFGEGFKDAILASRAARAAFDALDANDPARRKKLRPYHEPMVEIVPHRDGYR